MPTAPARPSSRRRQGRAGLPHESSGCDAELGECPHVRLSAGRGDLGQESGKGARLRRRCVLSHVSSGRVVVSSKTAAGRGVRATRRREHNRTKHNTQRRTSLFFGAEGVEICGRDMASSAAACGRRRQTVEHQESWRRGRRGRCQRRASPPRRGVQGSAPTSADQPLTKGASVPSFPMRAVGAEHDRTEAPAVPVALAALAAGLLARVGAPSHQAPLLSGVLHCDACAGNSLGQPPNEVVIGLGLGPPRRRLRPLRRLLLLAHRRQVVAGQVAERAGDNLVERRGPPSFHSHLVGVVLRRDINLISGPRLGATPTSAVIRAELAPLICRPGVAAPLRPESWRWPRRR